jgi:hypothetical protein
MIATGPREAGQTGRHDFDFLLGRWTVHNRRLPNPVDPHSTDWAEFVSYVATQPLLGGLGNLDKYLAPDFPGQPGLEAAALRLFDPERAMWRIWWTSTASPGQLDTPVLGGFAGSRGRFECDDVLNGHALRVRYEWLRGSASPRWTQSFSADRGRTWWPNWIMDWHRD